MLITSALPARSALKAAAPTRTPGPEDAFQPSWLPRPAGPPRAHAAVQAPAAAQVGDTRNYWVWDMSVMPPANKQIQATCRAVGKTSDLWVDDAAWQKLVKPEDVQALFHRFEELAPPGAVDISRGVAANNHDYFGNPPVGYNGDPKVTVLLTELATFHGTTMDGYFNAFDTLSDGEAQAQGQRSNERDVLYLNAAAQGGISGDYMQGVMAHEYQHLLHQPHDAGEESWLSETFGEMAMKINGYNTDLGHVGRHLAHPERPLVSQTYVDYGACMLFGSYLLERYGKGFAQQLSQDPRHGVDSINATLQAFGRPERFDSLYNDWVVANYADSRGVADPGLHYGCFDLPAPAELNLAAGQSLHSDLAPTGARYVKLSGSDPLQLNLTADHPGLSMQLLSFDGHRMERTPFNGGLVPAGADRVLVVGSLGQDKISFDLAASPPGSPPRPSR